MRNQIYYTFLAGWCADAAGARLEFRKKRYSEEEAIHAMHFVGEKSNGIHEGQFTDDSEMEICLLQGLINGKGEEEFPVEKIAKEYIKWFNSRPFDIGNTTTMALFDAKNADFFPCLWYRCC
jgi:ADP-ribosyl-[dinitrogen reductase] hydrolase